MARSFALFVALLALGCGAPQTSHSTTTAAIQGRVVDAATRAPAHARAHLIDERGQVAATVATAADGTFALVVPASRRSLVRIDITAAGHAPATLVVDAGEAARGLRTVVSLGGLGRAESLAPVAAFVEPAAKAASAPLVAQPDGTFALDVAVPDGTYHYLLSGVVGGHRVSGTGDYSYDGDEQRGEIAVHGGHARLVFDPAAWPAAASESEVHVLPESSASADLSSVYQLWANVVAPSTHAPGPTDAVTSALLEHARSARMPLVKQLATAVLLGVHGVSATMARQGGGAAPAVAPDLRDRARALLAQVPPGDPLWGTASVLYGVIDAAGGYQANAAFANAFIAQQPNHTVVLDYLMFELANGDAAVRRAILSAVDRKHFASKRLDELVSFFDPDRKLVAGRPMPAFSAPKLDGSGAWTGQAFARSWYLIDVWATWCPPCIEAMPTLQALHDRFGKQLHILSLSLDESKPVVDKFRTDRFPMPWEHGLLGGDRHGPFFRALGLDGTMIPFYVLVAPDGSVVATSPELDLKALPALLERAAH